MFSSVCVLLESASWEAGTAVGWDVVCCYVSATGADADQKADPK